ncbi:MULTISPECIES: cytochrome b [unclassified Chelatococcus]|uniref:cytochrome b n=1 Tax=unclassified Chelatococcus TaxID=2638111 RepID=UPI001BCC5095|nr:MULTISPECIES: cytochrome b [unclassified Chelatococcus]CAH1651772.1 Cytochrome B561 [Hyphomicrobiales bacterium]MBS7739898.1 cytochrome b [Chelatococcus sp. HY11]MBX3545542.1 cytochrome b [Chelatococcus sp.]MCO5078802.1 cytochrome b [Chelatococcus sp.]CAH1686182.1 Cytochrome B561 [Hyphomicrobiales bacterium]
MKPASIPAAARWSLQGRVLHWVMAALLVGLVALGLTMTRLHADLGTTFALYQAHKSYGLVALVLVVWRIVWRLRTSPPPPQAMRRAEWRMSRLVHVLFYGAMAALPLTGWLMASASPLRLPTRPFGLFTMPDLVAPDAGLFMVLRSIHMALAYGLVALLVLHVAGALKHRLIDRDDTLGRMGF